MKNIVKWNQELNVGIGLIDNQHKIIFDLINDLGVASEAMADRRVIDTLLNVIENYVFRHFEAEEELFVNQQGASEHCLHHYGLIKDFRTLRLGFRNRNTADNNTSVFLEQWFFTHIKEQDIPFFIRIANGGEERITAEGYLLETAEKRRHMRIDRDKISDNDIWAYCYNTSNLKSNHVAIVDISLGGLRINSSDPFSVGDFLVVSCNIGRNFTLKEKVKVLNAADQFYGAEFINLPPTTEKFLVELYGSVKSDGTINNQNSYNNVL
jgi:hemerythrin